MILLQIDHTVSDFGQWKAAFDRDPVGRQRSGVRAYRIERRIDNPNHVSIVLEFQTRQQAEALLAAMQQVWTRVSGTLVYSPQWQFSELVESIQY